MRSRFTVAAVLCYVLLAMLIHPAHSQMQPTSGFSTSPAPSSPAQNSSLTERCTLEVLRLHAFFEDWWNGRVQQTATVFNASFVAAQHSAFKFISPVGTSLNLSSTIDYIYQAWDSKFTDDWASASQVHGHPMRFFLSNVVVTWADEVSQTCTVTFQEHQQVGGTHGVVQTKANACVLKHKLGAPHSLGWLLEHETWWPGFVHQESCNALKHQGVAPHEIPACYNCTHCLPGLCTECLQATALVPLS